MILRPALVAAAVAAAAAAAGLSSCGTAGFYSQALRGQWEVQRQARPISDVLLNPTVPENTRVPLENVLAVRQFAVHALGLPDNQSYTTYADLGREHVVWVVFATREFSVEPKTWWYPFIGALEYRGYFSERAARALSTKLTTDGLETYVGGVDAYSTLGVLRDPVLNTFVHRGDTQVAELLFHELTHQRLYLSGDTDFNEALATAYAEHGVRRWLTSSGRTKELARYQAETRALRVFISLALSAREALAVSYAATAGQPVAERRAKKQAILDDFKRASLRLRQKHPELARVDRFFDEPVTNARLASLSTYYDLVPAFEALLAQCPDDPDAFFSAVEALGKKRKDTRHEELRALAPTPPQ